MSAVAATVASTVPLWQGQSYFEQNVRLNNELHRRSLQAANNMHREEQTLELALHRKGMALDQELHLYEMMFDVTIARREAIRDVWSQKSQLVQTLMIVDTLMFSCAAAVFCEGDLPAKTPLPLARAYAAVLGLSMGSLVVSVWLSIQLQARMARYDLHNLGQVYICGSTHHDFNDYFQCHCRRLDLASFGLFVFGTANCVAAGGMYLSAAMNWTLEVPAAAWTFAGLTLVAVVVAVAGLIPTAAGSAEEGVDVGGLAGVEDEREELVLKQQRLREAVAQEAAASGSTSGEQQQGESEVPPTQQSHDGAAIPVGAEGDVSHRP